MNPNSYSESYRRSAIWKTGQSHVRYMPVLKPAWPRPPPYILMPTFYFLTAYSDSIVSIAMKRLCRLFWCTGHPKSRDSLSQIISAVKVGENDWLACELRFFSAFSLISVAWVVHGAMRRFPGARAVCLWQTRPARGAISPFVVDTRRPYGHGEHGSPCSIYPGGGVLDVQFS